METNKKLFIAKLLIIIPALLSLIFCLISLFNQYNDLFMGLALLAFGIFCLLFHFIRIYENKLFNNNKKSIGYLLTGFITIILSIVILILEFIN